MRRSVFKAGKLDEVIILRGKDVSNISSHGIGSEAGESPVPCITTVNGADASPCRCHLLQANEEDTCVLLDV